MGRVTLSADLNEFTSDTGKEDKFGYSRKILNIKRLFH